VAAFTSPKQAPGHLQFSIGQIFRIRYDRKLQRHEHCQKAHGGPTFGGGAVVGFWYF
jgi:hypothetical protein